MILYTLVHILNDLTKMFLMTLKASCIRFSICSTLRHKNKPWNTFSVPFEGRQFACFSKLVYIRSSRNWHSNIIIKVVMTSQISNCRAQKLREPNGGPRIWHPNIIMLKVIKFDVGCSTPKFTFCIWYLLQWEKEKILLAEVRRKDYKFYPLGVGSGGIRYLFDWSQGQILEREKRKRHSNCKQDIFYILHAFRLMLWVLYRIYITLPTSKTSLQFIQPPV